MTRISKLRLKRETLSNLTNLDLDNVVGGAGPLPILNTLLFCPKPQPQSQWCPRPPAPSGSSCIGFQCPPGTLQTKINNCLPFQPAAKRHR